LLSWCNSDCLPFADPGASGNDGRHRLIIAASPSPQRSINPESSSKIHRETESEMSKEPKVEHEYHAQKDKLTIKIHRYSLKSKKTRDAILMKLMANLESKPDRLTADAKKQAKDGPGKKLPGEQKTSRLIEVGD
jgi:hypothetical protein